MKNYYFDNAATTKISKNALEKFVYVSENLYENSAALHIGGINAEREIESSRKIIAQSLGVSPSEVIFTSGGTESDNMAILGVCYANEKKGKHIITTSIEHHAVLNTCKHLENKGYEVTYINPDSQGKIHVEDIKNAIKSDTILVSVMAVNNETGVIQPIDKIKEICKNITFHTDAVQAYGKINLKNLNADLISVSGHKIHGPKGVGALIVKKGTKINPVIFGGNQDGVLHSGTMNTPAISAFSVAVKDMQENFNRNIELFNDLRNYTINKIKEIPDIIINGYDCVSIVNVSFKDIRGEVLLHTLENDGIFISTGSACNSKSSKISYVINAMNVPDSYAEGTIRISFSEYNTYEEIDYLAEKIKNAVTMLRKFTRR